MGRRPAVPTGALATAVAVILCAGAASGALSCYKCTVLPPPHSSNETARLCSHFDGSARFQVDCPYSTFCLKRTFELPLGKGKTVAGVERDCAPQRYRFQRYDEARGRWHTEDAVAEAAYAPGCAPERGEAARSVKSASATYCYCQSHLCNGATRSGGGGGGGGGVGGVGRGGARAAPAPLPTSHHTDAMAVIFVFNAMKYIRSLR
ncbi:hypothetical protein R5R35_003801 [Gryllus longicercus]|uniref:Protein quiver n=1 Tax=Gryllus longicercus TaxID=2509291 RepID=A0AAN9Z1D4_9ORTH